MEGTLLEAVTHDGAGSGRRDAAPPEWLRQPIADLRREARYILAGMKTNAARGASFDFDAEYRLIALRTLPKVRFGGGQRVRMRHAIAQINPGIAVVCPFGERWSIIGTPAAKDTGAEIEVHGRRLSRGTRATMDAIPATGSAPDAEITEPFLEITDPGSGGRIITVIEFVSRSNKNPGEGRELYLQKQKDCQKRGRESGRNPISCELESRLRSGKSSSYKKGIVLPGTRASGEQRAPHRPNVIWQDCASACRSFASRCARRI